MQTPKSRTGSLEVPKRTSLATPRTAKQLKMPGSDSEVIPSPNPESRTPKGRSPKVAERKSPRSPVPEDYYSILSYSYPNGRRPDSGGKALGDLSFQIGDYLDVAIL